MKNVSLEFYGGVNEIGGNKILLRDHDTKIFLDFGMSFGQSGKFFSEFLQPRKCNGLGDFFEFGLLPDLPGVYRQDYLKHMGRKQEEREISGVLLSHAHADHASFIHHLREDIPIYCSKESHAILKALNDTASAGCTDLTELKESFSTYVNKKGEISKATTRTNKGLLKPRIFPDMPFGKKFKIDNLEIVPYNVDHSLPGATGFIIHTTEGSIIYTGDIRFHGRRGEETINFMNKCKETEPDILLIEGTRINEQSTGTEKDVENEVSKISSNSKGLTVCNWPVRDTDRMISFLNAAKSIDKKLTIDFKQAYVLKLLGECNSNAPKLNDENIEIYAMRKNWGVIGDKSVDDKIKNSDYSTWEREFLDDSICFKDVKNNQSDYMFFCNNFELKELVDLKPVKGSSYIKSVCEPFDQEMEIDWNRIENWINHFGLHLNRTHVSGHASGPELKKFVETVNPKKVIPIHTEHAEFYEKWHGNVEIVKNNYTF